MSESPEHTNTYNTLPGKRGNWFADGIEFTDHLTLK